MPAGQQIPDSTPSDPFAVFAKLAPEQNFVIAQLGQSLDGRIATVSGDSKYINGEAALEHLHRIRAHVDAVVVGVSTIEADDPLLTVRRTKGRNPARVVIDPSGRCGTDGQWLTRDGTRLYVISAAGRTPSRETELIRIALGDDGKLCPHAMIAALAERGMRRILIEGGARTISHFLDVGALDRLHVLVAPLIIGAGRQGLDLIPVPELAKALRPPTNIHLLGNDVLFDCDLSACRRTKAAETGEA